MEDRQKQIGLVVEKLTDALHQIDSLGLHLPGVKVSEALEHLLAADSLLAAQQWPSEDSEPVADSETQI